MRDGEHKTAPEEARERGAAAEGYTATEEAKMAAAELPT